MSECGCDYDCDRPSFFNEKVIKKSRKDHRCVECRTVIPKGSNYTRVDFFWEGDFNSFAQCDQCTELIANLHSKERDLCLEYGNLFRVFDFSENPEVIKLGLDFFKRSGFKNKDMWMDLMSSSLEKKENEPKTKKLKVDFYLSRKNNSLNINKESARDVYRELLRIIESNKKKDS